VSVRTFSLVVGVLLIQLAFVLSYVGAFHHPTAHRIPIEVDAPAAMAPSVVARLNALPGAPLQATAAASPALARGRLAEDRTDGVFVVDPRSSTDTVVVAGGGGAALATAVQQVLTQVDAAQHRSVRVQDAVPAQSGDARGLSAFYLVVGWLVGGYLVASLLGVARGARPATLQRAVIRLLAIVPYAILSGLGGALIVGSWLCALTGHFLALWAVGTLLVLSAATVTMAFQVYLGVIGIGVTVLLFVVIGNPSAGGAYPAPLLPTFWRQVGAAIPNGAGVAAVRRIVYFGGAGVAANLAIIVIYAVAGAASALIGARVFERRELARPEPSEATA
jgi:hypothetical protein